MDKTFNSQEAAAIGEVDQEQLRAWREAGIFGKARAKEKEDEVAYELEELAIVEVLRFAGPFCGDELDHEIAFYVRKAKGEGVLTRARKRYSILVIERPRAGDAVGNFNLKWLEAEKRQPSNPDRLSINIELLWTNLKLRAAGFEKEQLLARLKELE